MNTSGKLHRKEKEFQVRRTEILAQAEKIFSAKGFHETTMAQIAEASGFSIGSLYHFFQRERGTLLRHGDGEGPVDVRRNHGSREP